MIYFNFSVRNPCHNEKNSPWKDIFQGGWTLTKNKIFEFRLDCYTYDLFEFELNTRWRGDDHAGPRFALRLFGLGLHVGIRDHRHWNYDQNCWVDYKEQQ